MSRTIRDSRSGGVLAVLLVAVLAVVCFSLFLRARSAEEAEATGSAGPAQPAKPAPFADVDNVLSDDGPARAADTRATAVRMKLSEMKAERAKVAAPPNAT